MNNLTVFTNDLFGEVRAMKIDGEPWFVLADVCKALEIKNPSQVAERLDDDQKGICPIYTLGGEQKMIIVDESGLYEAMFRSDKPEAQKFRKWVTKEVLPSIRKTGSYSLGDIPRKLSVKSTLELVSAFEDATNLDDREYTYVVREFLYRAGAGLVHQFVKRYISYKEDSHVPIFKVYSAYEHFSKCNRIKPLEYWDFDKEMARYKHVYINVSGVVCLENRCLMYRIYPAKLPDGYDYF